MRSLLQDTKEGRTIMEILGKVLSEKTEAIYKDITGGLIYPIKIVKLDPENEEDCSRPVAMDTGKEEYHQVSGFFPDVHKGHSRKNGLLAG